jgi:hypothetical protein
MEALHDWSTCGSGWHGMVATRPLGSDDDCDPLRTKILPSRPLSSRDMSLAHLTAALKRVRAAFTEREVSSVLDAAVMEEFRERRERALRRRPTFPTLERAQTIESDPGPPVTYEERQLLDEEEARVLPVAPVVRGSFADFLAAYKPPQLQPSESGQDAGGPNPSSLVDPSEVFTFEVDESTIPSLVPPQDAPTAAPVTDGEEFDPPAL